MNRAFCKVMLEKKLRNFRKKDLRKCKKKENFALFLMSILYAIFDNRKLKISNTKLLLKIIL